MTLSAFCSFSSFATSQIQPTIKLPTTRRRREGGVGRDRLPNSASSSTSFFSLGEGGFLLVFLAQRLLYVWCSFHLVWYYFVSFVRSVLCVGKERFSGLEKRLRGCRLNTSWALFKSSRKEKMVYHRLKDLVSPPKDRTTKGVQALEIWRKRKQMNQTVLTSNPLSKYIRFTGLSLGS